VLDEALCHDTDYPGVKLRIPNCNSPTGPAGSLDNFDGLRFYGAFYILAFQVELIELASELVGLGCVVSGKQIDDELSMNDPSRCIQARPDPEGHIATPHATFYTYDISERSQTWPLRIGEKF
jgi:hypothetical protein